jgi:Holliday junction resolvasome RuvABC DNA-binding subunit
MVDFISGNVVECMHNSGEVVLAAGPVRIRFRVPRREMPVAPGHCCMWVSLLFKGDAFQMYGFMSQGSRDAFERLCKVAGIGPGVAMKVLDKIAPDDLGQLLAARFAAVPGVGEKTAAALERAAKKW